MGPHGIVHIKNLGPMRIIRPYIHDGPMWALPKCSAYLHVGFIEYIVTNVLHYVVHDA